MYINEWPELHNVAGSVLVDNGNIEIEVDSGDTMDLAIGSTSAKVERDEAGQQWLTISGTADGSSQAGLDFLNAAPLQATLGDTMSNWRADGEVDALVDLRIPLSASGTGPTSYYCCGS